MFLMPANSIKFIKSKAALEITIGGIVEVRIAAYIIKLLPLAVVNIGSTLRPRLHGGYYAQISI